MPDIEASALISLADITLRTTAGELVRLGQLVERPTILVIPRYYGCLPCRDYLLRLSERLDQVEARGGAAVGADHQARWLMEEKGVRFPLLAIPTAASIPRSRCLASGG